MRLRSSSSSFIEGYGCSIELCRSCEGDQKDAVHVMIYICDRQRNIECGFMVTSRDGSPGSTFTVESTKSSSYIRISRLANKRKAAMMCVCLTMALSSRSSAYISSLHVQLPNGR
jgi:hypothetical protein